MALLDDLKTLFIEANTAETAGDTAMTATQYLEAVRQYSTAATFRAAIATELQDLHGKLQTSEQSARQKAQNALENLRT